jgi:alpha-amylase
MNTFGKFNLFKAIVFMASLLFSCVVHAESRTVMVHLFEWKWKDITKECKEFLGPAGFAGVQVSPPNEHAVVDGNPWYERYQPVSYKLDSRSGTREEFIEMVKECNKVGVSIYVDAVINHMTGVVPQGMTKQGIAGSSFGYYNYPGTYSYDDFHHCGKNGNDNIQNYGDRWEVQNCELVDLADLDTGADYVQKRIADYLTDLTSIGVAGFRIDAAKHMATNDIRRILNKMPSQPYIYQEVIDQGGEPIQAQEYFQNGDVTEFKYSLDIGRIFHQGQLAWLNGKNQFGEGWGYMPSDKAIVFIDNHDNQRGHGGGGGVLTHKDGRLYELASILMLAWPYGYPQIMSSYAFPHGDASSGPPSDRDGRTENVNCMDISQSVTANRGWVCEHRWNSIAAMVGFRNATDQEFRLTNWWTNGNNQIAFGRGGAGFVVINNEDHDLEREFQTDLPAGKYCDVISDNYQEAGCTGKWVYVDQNGVARIKTSARSATAIHK